MEASIGVKRPMDGEQRSSKRHREEALPAALSGQAPVIPKLAHDEVQIESDEEKDERRVAQRQKQIDFGKNTIGYDVYLRAIPKNKRKQGDPVTPRANKKMSKRQFDGLIRSWRKKLHAYDPPTEHGVGDAAKDGASDHKSEEQTEPLNIGIEEAHLELRTPQSGHISESAGGDEVQEGAGDSDDDDVL